MDTIKRVKSKVGGTLKRQTGENSITMNSDSNPAKEKKYVVMSRTHPNRTWPHDPPTLLYGVVSYQCKYIGKVEVAKDGSSSYPATIRDAIRKLNFQYTAKQSEVGHSGSWLPKVALSIGLDEISLTDVKTNHCMDKYKLYHIAHISIDSRIKSVFAFISRRTIGNNDEKLECHVFESKEKADEIARTVLQTFDMAKENYERSGDLNRDIIIRKYREKLQSVTDENKKLQQRTMMLERELQEWQKRYAMMCESVKVPSKEAPSSPSVPAGFKSNIFDESPTFKSNVFDEPPTFKCKSLEKNAKPPPLPSRPPPKVPPKLKDDFDPRKNERKAKRVEELKMAGLLDRFDADPFDDEFFTEVTAEAAKLAIERQKVLDREMAELDEESEQMARGFGVGSFMAADGDQKELDTDDLGAQALVESIRIGARKSTDD